MHSKQHTYSSKQKTTLSKFVLQPPQQSLHCLAGPTPSRVHIHHYTADTWRTEVNSTAIKNGITLQLGVG